MSDPYAKVDRLAATCIGVAIVAGGAEVVWVG